VGGQAGEEGAGVGGAGGARAQEGAGQRAVGQEQERERREHGAVAAMGIRGVGCDGWGYGTFGSTLCVGAGARCETAIVACMCM
jgi:hypothetical protein